MLIQTIMLMGLALVCALAAAYLLGEAVGSRTQYEPVPPDDVHAPFPEPVAVTEQGEFIDALEHPVVVELLPQVTATELDELDARLEQVTDEVDHAHALASRYRREALVMRKRYEAAVSMLLAPRRPSHEAIEAAVVEVHGREVPVVVRK